jgi:Zinc finger, C2H2 type
MTTSLLSEARPNTYHLFPPGKTYSAFMAGSMPNSSDPVAISNPLPAPPTSLLSGSSDQISFLKPSPTKPESHLSSIASAGLRTSPSPGFESPVHTSAPGMASSIAAGPPNQPTELGKEQESQHQDSPRVAREALGVAVEASKENEVRLHDSSNTFNDPAETSAHPVQVSADDMQVDSHASPGILAEQSAAGDQTTGQMSLMNTSTVASPGPIEETTSQDGDRPRHQLDHVAISDDANKAFSYPMPAASPLDPRRGLSLPHSGFHKGSPRSPSAKKHRCPYCSTEFTRHHNLKSHLLTHSQEKPYVCQTCQSRFRRLHDLKRHTKLHTGERPHICDKCGRRFARGDALARHNKGQGGCAGRRSSMGSYVGEEDFGDPGAGADDTMDGLMYTEPERMDEEDERRLGMPGMPSMRKHNVSSEPMPRAPSMFQPRAPSTYPPIATTTTQPPPSSRNLFPPPNNHGGGSSSSTSPISQSGTMTFPVAAHSSTSTSFPAPNMTESPKPLSPNTLSTQVGHGGDSGIHTHQHRPHSPGLNQQYQQSHFRQGGLGLPPPQLPPPPGLNAPDSRFLHSQGSVQNGPPSTLTAKHGGSHSHSSSLGAPLPSPANVESGPSESNVQGDQSREDKLWAYIRSVHDELGALRAEVSSLRSQLQSQGASSQAQSGSSVR